MSEGVELYKAILAEPLKDDVRLIYADWLEDNGDPVRAEFIRIQLELHHAKECLHDSQVQGSSIGCGYCRMKLRQDLLLIDGDRLVRWISNFPAFSSFSMPIFRRGFLDEVRAPIDVLEKHLPAIVKLHPITKVMPTDRSPGGGPGIRFFWHDDQRTKEVMIPGSPYVPKAACDQMVKDGWSYDLLPRDGGPPTSSLRTRAAAFDALSKAMLTVSRRAS